MLLSSVLILICTVSSVLAFASSRDSIVEKRIRFSVFHLLNGCLE